MKSLELSVSLVALAAASMCAAQSASAQDVQAARPTGAESNAPGSPGPSGQPRQPDADQATGTEIVVTARRVQESAQKVPVAIEALSAKSIRELHINSRDALSQNIAGLANSSPSVNGNDAGVFVIRGQGQSFGGTPGVVVYFSDVPSLSFPNQNAGPLGIDGRPGTFIDLTNVQVLKGPQGTLFGRNSTGGAVLLVPQRPTTEFGGYVTAGVGNYSDRSIEGALNLPIWGDKLLLRVSGGVEKRDGFTKDLGNPSSRIGDVNYQTIRAAVDFKPSDLFENYFIGRYYHSTGGQGALILAAVNPAVADPNLVAYLPVQQKLGKFTVDSRLSGYYTRTKFYQAINTTTVHASDAFVLKNIFSYSTFAGSWGMDVEGTPLTIINQTGQFRPTPKNSTLTEEVQATGSLFSDHLTYAVGFYTDKVNTLEPDVQDFQYYPFIAGGVPDIPPGTVPGIPGIPGWPSFLTFDGNTSSRAVYAQTTLDLGLLTPALERLKVTGGWRQTTEKSFSKAWQVASVIFANYSQAHYKNNYPSFTFDMSYQINPSTMVYGSVRDAYKTGGVNVQLKPSNEFYTFKPEKLVSYEAGVKSRATLGPLKLQYAADIFYGKYTDIQRTVVDLNVTPGAFAENAAAATIKGLELDANARLYDNMDLHVSYAYMKGKYTKITSAAQANLVGQRLPYIPEGRLTASLGYGLSFIPQNWGSLRLNVNYSYQSSTTFAGGATISPLGNVIPSYSLWGLGADWANFAGAKNLTLSAYARNLGNKTYVLNRFDAYTGLAGFVAEEYGARRTFGLALRYDF